MEKIEIAEPVDTVRRLSDVFLVEVQVMVTDTQAGKTKYMKIKVKG